MLPKIPKVSQLAPGIIRILGMNPSPMTLQGTNSYIIGVPTSKSRLLIDTSNPDKMDYIEIINQYFQDNLKNLSKISDIIITHWHPDHIGAVSNLFELAKSLNWPKPNVYKFPSVSHEYPDIKLLKDNEIFDLTEFGLGSLQILYTPGHTNDHICLLLKPENILFSGDLILGNGSTTFEDLSLYMASLRKLEAMQDDIKMILPAHGIEITEPANKIKEYLENRLNRIEQVYNALDINNWQSEMEIIVKVYTSDVTENAVLIWGALKNQNEALKYLLNQQNVEARSCTEDENKKAEKTFSGKMWRRTNKIYASL